MEQLGALIIKFIFATAAPLAHLGAWGYGALFLIALVESLIIFGSFIPGSVGIIFAGFLAAHGYYNFGLLVLAAAAGGIIGDSVSYFVGTKSARFFKPGSRWLNEKNLERGKKFFSTYGDKSILLGRFTGPLRPIIPFIAGISHMDKRRFQAWNVGSAFVWVTFHLTLGYFFGTSLEAIEKWSPFAGVALLILVGAIILLMVAVQHRQKLTGFLNAKSAALVNVFISNTYISRLFSSHPRTISFVSGRFKRHTFSGLPLTFFILLFLSLVFILAGVTEKVLKLGAVTGVDERLLNFSAGFHHPAVTSFFIFITNLGGEVWVPSVAAVAIVYLFMRKHLSLVIPFAGVLAFAEAFNLLGKQLVGRSRPLQMLVEETSFSFPSGHATLSMALYGFLIYIIIRTVKNVQVKIWSTIIFAVLIFLIGISRVYLGVHYASDVFAGFVLGALCAITGMAFCEYRLAKKSAK